MFISVILKFWKKLKINSKMITISILIETTVPWADIFFQDKFRLKNEIEKIRTKLSGINRMCAILCNQQTLICY